METKVKQEVLEEVPEAAKKPRKPLKAGVMAVVAVMISMFCSIGVFAESGTGGASFDMTSVTGSITSVIIPMLNQVMSLMTSNPLLSAFLAVGLIGIGVTVFRRIKRAARG